MSGQALFVKKRLPLGVCAPEVLKIIAALQKKGFQAVLCGGAVRDFLLHKKPKDMDLAVSARPKELLKIFPQAKANFIRYGVVFLPLKGKSPIEIATFRKDSLYKDGRRPESVSFCGMREDAERRDFTVNALFYDPLSERIIDWTGGLKDLRDKTLRAVGRPEQRFQEDWLRPLRALSLAHRLNFRIEAGTKKALPLFAEKIGSLPRERVRDELVKMLSAGRLALALNSLKESGFFEGVLPDLPASCSHLKDPFDFWSKPFPQEFCQKPGFFWAALALPFFYRSSAKAQAFLHGLRLSKSDIQQSLRYLSAVRLFGSNSSLMARLQALDGQKREVSLLARFWRQSRGQSLAPLEKTLQEFSQREHKGRLCPPLVTGRDLLKLKPAPPKKEFSGLLALAFERQIIKNETDKSKILKSLPRDGFKQS